MCSHHNTSKLNSLSTTKNVFYAEDITKDTLTSQVTVDISNDARKDIGRGGWSVRALGAVPQWNFQSKCNFNSIIFQSRMVSNNQSINSIEISTKSDFEVLK